MRLFVLLSLFIQTYSVFASGPHSSVASWKRTPVEDIQLSDVEKKLQALATKEENCTLDYLRHLGWNIKPSEGSAIEITEGTPCEKESLAESKKGNELVISLPRTATEADLKDLLSKLGSLSTSKASKCAYKFKVSEAAKKATDKLHRANTMGTYSFTNNSDPFVGHFNKSHWGQDSGNCISVCSSPSKAIQCYYSETCRSECAVGLQVASLAILYELYGDKEFDKRFQNQEICVGSWSRVQSSENPIERGFGGEDAEAQKYFELGKQALIGVRGYIGNLRGESYLDSSADRGENMVIVEASQKAIDEVKKLGGLRSGTRKINIEIWAGLTEGSRKQSENDFLSSQGISPSTDYSHAKELLKNPIYTDIKVYVHPLGLMTLGAHLERLGRNNPRTPYEFQLYPDRLMSTLYDRYKQANVDACMGK